jgi:protein-tyrosine-phosphatase
MNQDRKYVILFVCTGNTCRSPMAEGIAVKIAAERNIHNLEIRSAGIGTIDGQPATDYAVEVSSHWDINIGNHRSTVLTKQIVHDADLIIAMSHEHVDRIVALDKQARGKTYLLKGFPNDYNPGQARVDDPIGCGLEQYNQTFLELDEALRKIFPIIIERAKAKG